MKGWIKLHREITEWQWYQKPYIAHLFIYLLLKANHADGQWQGILVKRGQLITGREKLQQATGISEYGVKDGLKKLQKSNSIVVKSSNKYSLITICNYDAYQNDSYDIVQEITRQTAQQSTQQKSSKNPSEIQQTSTNKNKEKKIEEVKEYSDEILNFYDEILVFFPQSTIPKEVAKRKGWLDAIVELKEKHSSLHELKKIIQHYRKDDFWAGNFLTLPKLLTKNKDGIRYIDLFQEKMKSVKPELKIVSTVPQGNSQLKNKYKF